MTRWTAKRCTEPGRISMVKEVLGIVATLGLMSGCGVISLETNAVDHVGENVLAVSERDIPAVAELDLPEPRLFRSQEEWDDWYASEVPLDVREYEVDGLPGPSFDNSVAVAGAVRVCDESATIVHDGDGQIALALEVLVEVSTPCTESPTLFTVYEVALDQIDVSDPADVDLVTEYRRLG